MQLETKNFGETPQKQIVNCFILRNDNQVQVEILNYGGIISRLFTPDRSGNLSDIVLGYDTLQEYIHRNQFFGCIVGRYANRIANGKFEIEGKIYHAAQNLGKHHLHGGDEGFDRKVWKAKSIKSADFVGVSLSFLSQNGEENYPGNLKIKVDYTLNNKNELKIEYYAETDQPTIVNLTNHSYFNLKGAGEGNCLDHDLVLNANYYTPVDKELIPTGEYKEVEKTPLDFVEPHSIGERIHSNHETVNEIGGYDHNFVINHGQRRKVKNSLGLAAKLSEKTTGRSLKVYTTKPGIQLYTSNSINEIYLGKEGKRYSKYGACCLETQYFPDSPNQPNFPSVILTPKKPYQHTTVYKFETF